MGSGAECCSSSAWRSQVSSRDYESTSGTSTDARKRENTDSKASLLERRRKGLLMCELGYCRRLPTSTNTRRHASRPVRLHARIHNRSAGRNNPLHVHGKQPFRRSDHIRGAMPTGTKWIQLRLPTQHPESISWGTNNGPPDQGHESVVHVLPAGNALRTWNGVHRQSPSPR
jgi:hypothetical protein